MLTRTEIINHFIKTHSYKTYLEIGCQRDVNFNAIEIGYKIGVDPEMGGTHRMTSDQFFEQNVEKFDIIFIDGLHEYSQVYKDVQNALKVLNEGGVIICHDCNPTTEVMQKVPREVREWTGDCWKAFVRLRHERDDLEMRVIDTDYGVGIIRKGKQIKLETFVDTYQEFMLNKKKLLNLVSEKEFKQLY